MAISFNQIPASVRLPWVYVEFDGTKAVSGSAVQPYKVLLVGCKTTAGSQALETPARITSPAQAKNLFGTGSILHGMAQRYFQQNDSIETWAVAVAEPGAGVAATGTVVIGGTASVSGTINLYIAGRRVQIPVTAGDATTAIATAASAAINAVTDMPVVATVSSSTVTLTARHKGVYGNEIDIRLNVYGESLPGTITATITAMASGSGAPTLTTLFAALGETHYNLWAWPFTDSASLVALETELPARSGPLKQIDSVAFIAKSDTYANMATFGAARNSEFVCCAATQKSPTPTYEYAAAIVGQVALAAQIDPALPFRTLPLYGVIPPKQTDRYTSSERNLLLYDGISALSVDAGGVVRIEYLITMYQTNPLGAEDVAYLSLNTILTLSYLRYDFRNTFLTKYGRHKLANDGIRIGEGQKILTPKLAKSEIVAMFTRWEERGLVENSEKFKENLIVERNTQDVNRLDCLLPPDLVNQLLVVGAQIQFRLQEQ
ncbi:hypothetical protein VF14_18410 [Nostoc linckia z18]|uniref:Phage tail protein n=2 Tax=Nostoc linckia TaxID=92942 RepID=A0A9Q6EJP1_NOSLI|nr:phage tail sheath subtilisin-like domain-containing protein [Nostoc linckia]PHJ81962.1 hypothetical protein VF07_29120 [Nostoc linckia z6]PHJ92860.1 hypothetical protein VF04_27835 [Nostoc linckia z7]PHK00817.1 hypothetical protein VF08_23410 [Nostoc linckia z8]PHK09305.1 hypothetical protein VF09_15895 [Nostoc linckia z9]PHK33091.1 hypothetical protein VF14_18410 [Nostoc linckia z18]